MTKTSLTFTRKISTKKMKMRYSPSAPPIYMLGNDLGLRPPSMTLWTTPLEPPHALIVERHAEIDDRPHRHIELEEEENSWSNGSRGAERPTWPRIAAALLAVAWKLPRGELQHFLLPLSLTNSHISTSPPLTPTEGQRKRKRGVRETKLSIASYCDLEIWRPPFELIQQGVRKKESFPSRL
jgi:hypothetical protein